MKHYGCSLVLAREVVGSRGKLLGSQQMKVMAGSQTKVQARKVRKPITLGKSVTCCRSIIANIHLRSWQDGDDQEGLC